MGFNSAFKGLIKDFSLHFAYFIERNLLPLKANLLTQLNYTHGPRRIFYLLVVDENGYAPLLT